jgi:hypothetical protein
MSSKPPMRDALVAAAFQLFLERGYEQTTIDDIVALAGVGRRSFFRYFPSKEDVVFPDHERCLADMTAFLSSAATNTNPCGGSATRPGSCCACTTRTRPSPCSATASPRRCRGCARTSCRWCGATSAPSPTICAGASPGRPDGTLQADVIAAAVVAAHNNALRSWLRSDGQRDAGAEVDHALGYVQSAFGHPPVRPVGELREQRPEDVVVVVSRRGAPMWRVVQEIEAAFGRD